MKTYFFYASLAFVLLGCSKSGDGEGNDGGGEERGEDAAYELLVTQEGLLTTMSINATAETTTLNPATSAFDTMPVPDLVYNDGTALTTYHQDTDCSGKLAQFDFSDNSSQNLDLFGDLTDCTLMATAVAHSNDRFYVAYGLENATMGLDYFIRVVDPDKLDANFSDIALKTEPSDPTYIPRELVFANHRLFVLVHDEEATDEYHLLVLDGITNNLIHDIRLGFDVEQIFVDPTENIIISYDELHSIVNSGTMAITHTNYEPATKPGFTDSKYNHFDTTGKMYYEMPPGSHSSYPVVPAVYDFDEQLTILYAYENFLTEAQRNFEYEIENTTAVGYDAKNELILVGYKKTGGTSNGGLMRIKPVPEPALVDNLDVEGIPYAFFVR